MPTIHKVVAALNRCDVLAAASRAWGYELLSASPLETLEEEAVRVWILRWLHAKGITRIDGQPHGWNGLAFSRWLAGDLVSRFGVPARGETEQALTVDEKRHIEALLVEYAAGGDEFDPDCGAWARYTDAADAMATYLRNRLLGGASPSLSPDHSSLPPRGVPTEDQKT